MAIDKRATPFRGEGVCAKHPAAVPHHVGTVAEDEQSYIVQILYDSISNPMASFWGISKAELTARELHASELHRFFLNLAPLAADDDLRSLL